MRHRHHAGDRLGTPSRLGNLERTVMEILWQAGPPPAAHGEPATGLAPAPAMLTVREVAGALPGCAYTTVLTVLGRLERKGFVRRDRTDRTHRYGAVATSDAYTAELMAAALDGAMDRQAALSRFVAITAPEDAANMRALLNRVASQRAQLDTADPGSDTHRATDGQP